MKIDQFNKELQSDKIVMVDFYADWCGPCRTLSTILDEVENEMSESTKLIKINVDDSGELAQKFGIRGIPTLLFFKDGEVKSTLVGIQSKDEIIKHITE